MNGKMAASHANVRGSLKAACTKVSPFIEQETAGSNCKCIMHCDCIGRGVGNVKVLLQ